jgi:hypothetical protein
MFPLWVAIIAVFLVFTLQFFDLAKPAYLCAPGSPGRSKGPRPHWTPPKQRGRPSYALKRLMEQWCGDHGWLWCYPPTNIRLKLPTLTPISRHCYALHR